MEDDIILIWYDLDFDDCVTEIKNQSSCEHMNFYFTAFSKLHSCISYIESKPKNDIIFITSPINARNILPFIHKMRQLYSVLLISHTNEKFEDLLKDYSKIISCAHDTKMLHKLIKENIYLSQKQNVTFSFYNQHKKLTREISKESAGFLWFQLFKNALLNMPSNDINAKEDLVQYLKQRYHNNNKQMKLIENFQETYQSDDAIQWYTGQPFLYRHVNKALRTEDLDQLYIFRFFITDLCKSLLQKFQILKEFEPEVTLYRGTRILID
ncbi:unnamed protein product, partial [Adineta steineri]